MSDLTASLAYASLSPSRNRSSSFERHKQRRRNEERSHGRDDRGSDDVGSSRMEASTREEEKPTHNGDNGDDSKPPAEDDP
eukprot:scaffold1727_cov133-Cylindrotheca_fusiformis.AAC.59